MKRDPWRFGFHAASTKEAACKAERRVYQKNIRNIAELIGMPYEHKD